LGQNLFDMDKTVFISLPLEDLQTVIIDCVNSCLINNCKSEQINEASEKLLTVKEAAKFLHLTVPTIYGKVSKGELPYMKRSKRLYFSSIELTEYLKDGQNKSNSQIELEAEMYLSLSKKVS
jgi:excisionase family DNA binding protein